MNLKTITLEGGEYVINYKNLNRTFSGNIYESDFDTNHPMIGAPNRSIIADRIAADMKFDQMCAKNCTNR